MRFCILRSCYCCHHCSQARYVLLTDLNPITVRNLQHNIALNEPLFVSTQQPTTNATASKNSHSYDNVKPSVWQDRVQASTIDWLDRQTWPQPPLSSSKEQEQAHHSQHQLFDVVLGSDLIYQASTAPMLRNVVAGLLRPGGTFYYVAPTTNGRDGLPEFIESLQQEQVQFVEMSDVDDKGKNDSSSTCRFELVAATLAPKHYHNNPLCSQDEDDFFLHFHELTSSEYMLYEFVKL